MSEVPLYDGRTCPVLFCQMANLEILFGPRKSQRCLEKCFTTLTTFSIWWGGGGGVERADCSVSSLQGYLAQRKQHPPGTLQ